MKRKILQVQTIVAQLQTKTGVMDVLNDCQFGLANGATFNRRHRFCVNIHGNFVLRLICYFGIHFM